MTALTVAGAAFAAQDRAPDAKAQAKVLQDLAACPRIAEDARRLACYDAAAGALIQAETQGEVVVVDRAQVREVRRQAFGFQIPSLNIFSRSGDKTGAPSKTNAAEEDDPDRFVATVASSSRTAEGKTMFTTSEGALWVQTDTRPVDRLPSAGAQVTIVRGKVGGFFCDVTRYQSVRCERRK